MCVMAMCTSMDAKEAELASIVRLCTMETSVGRRRKTTHSCWLLHKTKHTNLDLLLALPLAKFPDWRSSSWARGCCSSCSTRGRALLLLLLRVVMVMVVGVGVCGHGLLLTAHDLCEGDSRHDGGGGGDWGRRGPRVRERAGRRQGADVLPSLQIRCNVAAARDDDVNSGSQVG